MPRAGGPWPVVAAIPVDIRVSYGSRSGGMFEEIVITLSESRGREPDVIDGVGHGCCRHPAAIAGYLAGRGS